MLQIQRFCFNPFQENTYIIYTAQGECIVFDPGFYGVEESREFWHFIQEKQLTVQQIFLTHTHLDHIFGLDELVGKTQITPQLHQLEHDILDYGSTDALRFGFEMSSYIGPVTYINSATKLEFANHKIEILHTPGHSPGSLVFYFASEAWAIVGDVLFKGSIGRTDLRLSSYADLLHSLKSQILKLPPETRIYPGHGPYTNIQYEQNNNPFLQDI